MNGVKQDHSVPGMKRCGVGKGVAYPVNGSVGMGGNQYAKHDQSGRKVSAPPVQRPAARGHDGRGNSTYK